MQTMKTTVVIGLLMVVMYGVYTVLTEPDSLPPQAMEQDSTRSVQVDMDEPLLDDSFESSFRQTPAGATAATQPVEPTFDGDSGSREPVPIDPTAGTLAPQTTTPAAGDEGGADDSNRGNPDDTERSNFAAAVPDSVESRATGVTPATISATSQERSVSSESQANQSFPDPQVPDPARTATIVKPLDPEPGPMTTASSPSEADAVGSDVAASRSPRTAARMFEVDWLEAHDQIARAKFRPALARLSKYFNHQQLSTEQHERLLGLLDPLAGKVVYSTEHLVLPVHKVGQHETLTDIAKQYQVPWQLLQNINAVRNPATLVPGTELKVVQGPFRAEVDLSHGELAVFVGELYAGRFVFAPGVDPTPQPGEYVVQEKRQERDYVGIDGQAWPAKHPENPYGEVWIDLGQRLCIHGSPLTASSKDLPTGCISLAPRDAADVFAILSAGSVVRIYR